MNGGLDAAAVQPRASDRSQPPRRYKARRSDVGEAWALLQTGCQAAVVWECELLPTAEKLGPAGGQRQAPEGGGR